MNETNFNPKHLYTLGGIAALVQLAAILATIVVAVAFGPDPPTPPIFLPSNRPTPWRPCCAATLC